MRLDCSQDFERKDQVQQRGVQMKTPRYPDVDSLQGAAGKLNKPLTWKQVKKIAYEDRQKLQKWQSHKEDKS